MGLRHSFEAAFATFTLTIITQGSSRWYQQWEMPVTPREGALRHSSFPLSLSHLSSSCKFIMLSSFPLSPGFWLPGHSSSLVSVPSSSAPISSWPRGRGSLIPQSGVTRWCYCPVKYPPLHCSTAQPLQKGSMVLGFVIEQILVGSCVRQCKGSCFLPWVQSWVSFIDAKLFSVT